MSLRSVYVFLSFTPGGGGLSRREAVVCVWLCSWVCSVCTRQHGGRSMATARQMVRRARARGCAGSCGWLIFFAPSGASFGFFWAACCAADLVLLLCWCCWLAFFAKGAGEMVFLGAARLVVCAGASAEPGMRGALGRFGYLGRASEVAAARARVRAKPVLLDKPTFF